MKKQLLFLSLLLSLTGAKAQNLYFPPVSGSGQWDTFITVIHDQSVEPFAK
jgi:hypothetical protein